MSLNTAQFQKAMKAALDGPEAKKIKPEKHEFNVKKVRIVTTAGGIEVDGSSGHHISHHRSLRPDDQIFFRCKVDKSGAVRDLDINFDESWANAFLRKLSEEILDRLFGEKSDTPMAHVPAKDSEKLLDGSWQGEAKFLIVNIIVHAAARHLPGVSVPTPVPA